jgi:hypothetical protein
MGMARASGATRRTRAIGSAPRAARHRAAGVAARSRLRAVCLAAGALALGLLFISSASALAAAPAWELSSIHGPTNVPLVPTVNQRDEMVVQGSFGKLVLEVGGQEKTVEFNASAEEVQKALEKFSAIGKGNVLVTGGPGDPTGSKPYFIEYLGALAGHEIKLDAEIKEISEKKEEEIEEEGLELAEAEANTVVRAVHSYITYQLDPRNLGAAPTTGPITLTDVLPPGVTTKATPEGSALSPGIASSEWACSPAGPGSQEVTCTSSKSVLPDSAAQPVTIEAYVDNSVGEGALLTNHATISGGGAATVETSDTALVNSTPAPYGLQAFNAGAFGPNGEKFTQAGGRPYAATTGFFFDSVAGQGSESGEIVLAGNLKDALVKVPAGFIGNPQVGQRCPQAVFTEGIIGGPIPGGSCPAESQVGIADVYFKAFGVAPEPVAVYNLQPPPGVPAEFGFIFKNVPIRLDAHLVREPGEHGEYRVAVLSADVNEAYNIFGVALTLWGVPADATHDAERFETLFKKGVASTSPDEPFLTNPVDCVGEAADAPRTNITFDRWESPGGVDAQGNPVNALSDPNWLNAEALSPPVTGCQLLSFAPTIAFQPTTSQADEPTGAGFDLTIPQDESPSALATPELKDTTVTLPQGVTLSPSAANGLQACSDAQIAVESTERGACPDAAQVGTVTIQSQLLEKPLNGRVYIGEPQCSPCSPQDAEDGKLFRLFIEAEGSGVRVKLPGTASVNDATNRITTTFKNNPQTPFETLHLTLKGGPRAPLATPQACGTYTATAQLTPWSRGGIVGGVEIPGTPDALPTFAFAIDWDGAGGACPASLPFKPSLQAGTENPTAGAYTPFDVTFTRHDREQTLSGITVQTPAGLLGKIAGITRCGEAAANAGTCPAGSRIATATSAAGAGSDPFVVSGPVYLTNGYKGAPFGLSIVVPADAGPFHLGNVIVRAAINIDPVTSAITITSDPLPQSRDGVPFRLQTVKVRVDRREFMFNPTNCEPKAIGANLTGAPGKGGEAPAAVHVSTPFTATNCGALPFKPKFTASSQAKTSKLNGASLTVKVIQPPGSANIRKVEVQLPIVLPSRLTTIQKACTEKQFETNPAGCPEGSNVGTARAITPLLSVPLAGPAYLVSHGGAAFPDLVFLLQGEGVHIELTGHTDIKKGITYSRFEAVPDAPVVSFETNLPEGPHSILAANGNLCAAPVLAPTKILAQNNAQFVQKTRIAITGCPKAKPSVRILKARHKGNALLITVRTSKAGTVKISGRGLKTTVKRGVKAGRHQIRVRLKGAAGRAAAKHHAKIKARATLTVGAQSVTTSAKVRA